ncbi:four helix bundle protein [Segetibacter sp. 3557_3]|uniref:four helix bundle protein n=1 Tax=Segetibacter sp. 3557_3 TaxID=2547429 RepID=UPI001058D9E9|nr:four helix bundle protein [Segetibacter sp. 3557_3]TDH23071.1 four helix bundle protein [Segetibacter sp. 3557_3]
MSETPHQSFTQLDVWKKTRVFKNEIFDVVKSFPADEKYRLGDQLIRASRSINANISEGHGRYTFKDQLHFCIQARGSLSECYNHLIDAYDAKYIDKEKLQYLKNFIDEIERLLNGYISWLRKNTST